MKRFATAFWVVVGVLTFSSAFALDLQQRNLSPSLRHQLLTEGPQAVLGCDDGYAYNAWFEGTDDRFGNLFDFGAGSLLDRVTFAHYGFGFPGPYLYDVEVWDPASCTYVAGENGLVAADAASAIAVEDIDLCPSQIYLSGTMVVTIDPNSCLSPTDCYPDVLFDDQVGVVCPVIINSASTAPQCFDVSDLAGPFLLRVETNNCPTPTKPQSWGRVKAIYR